MLSLLKKRVSVRSYQDKPVEEEKIAAILEAGRISPSARNRQTWRFVVVRDQETRTKLRGINKMRYCEEAPVFIAIVGIDPDNTMPNGVYTDIVDTTIATTSMMLMATEFGLGTCWIGAFDQKAVKELLNAPENSTVVNILLVGYGKKEMVEKDHNRKPIETIAIKEKF